MNIEKQLAEFYDHYERFVFDITDTTKSFHHLKYNILVPEVTLKSEGIEKKYGKHNLNIMFSTDSDIFRFIRGVEEFIERKVITENPDTFAGYTFKSILSNHAQSGNTFSNIQVPYRNKVCECVFVTKSGKHIMDTGVSVSESLKKNDKLKIQLRTACIWIYPEQRQIGITWQAKHVYLLK